MVTASPCRALSRHHEFRRVIVFSYSRRCDVGADGAGQPGAMGKPGDDRNRVFGAGRRRGLCHWFRSVRCIEPWLRESHYWDAYQTSRQWFDDYGVWVVFVAGFSPIPYKVFTIAAGVAVLNLPAFIIASIIGRAGRFFLVAGLVRVGGQRFEDTLSKYVERIGWATVLIAAVVIGWLMLR